MLTSQSPVRYRSAVSALMLGVFICPVLSGCGEKAEAETPQIAVRVMTVGADAAANPNQAPSYSGVVMPRIESAVAFRVAGRMTDRKVNVGDSVRGDQVLATLDPAPFKLAIDAASSVVTAATAERSLAAGEVARNKPLADRGIVAAAQFDRLKNARDTTEARLSEAQSRLSVAQDDLGYAALKAPTSGVVTEVSAEVGQYLAPGQVAFRVARPDTLEAVVDVPEAVVASLKADTPAIVELLANSGKPLAAHVREIAPAADAATRTYRVRVVLQDAQQARIGMTARVRFAATVGGDNQRTVMSFRLPMQAIFNQDKQTAVWVVSPDGGSIALRPVTVAAFDSNGATITSGLSQGERIVTAGVHRLDAQQRVRIWNGDLP